jgi:2-(3-amino-3-carboxypropyl)histidine synthase
METLYIEARKKFPEEIDFSPLDALEGKTISLAATVQYLDLIPKAKAYLEKQGKEVIIKQGAFHEAHVIGCNSAAFDKEADELVLLTDGKFHALNNAVQLQKEISVFNTHTLEKVTKQDIEEVNKKTQAKKAIFLSSDNIGILVSSKHGQHNSGADQIAKKIEKLDKKAYLFQSNNINTTEFENFPQIQIWINTACYGLARDHPKIINLRDVLEFI